MENEKLPKPSVAIKRRYKKEGKGQGLKYFAEQLLKNNDPLAQVWLYNKGPIPRQKAKEERWGRKGGKIMMERTASKAARKK